MYLTDQQFSKIKELEVLVILEIFIKPELGRLCDSDLNFILF
jgi:hypothetical protein